MPKHETKTFTVKVNDAEKTFVMEFFLDTLSEKQQTWFAGCAVRRGYDSEAAVLVDFPDYAAGNKPAWRLLNTWIAEDEDARQAKAVETMGSNLASTSSKKYAMYLRGLAWDVKNIAVVTAIDAAIMSGLQSTLSVVIDNAKLVLGIGNQPSVETGGPIGESVSNGVDPY